MRPLFDRERMGLGIAFVETGRGLERVFFLSKRALAGVVIWKEMFKLPFLPPPKRGMPSLGMRTVFPFWTPGGNTEFDFFLIEGLYRNGIAENRLSNRYRNDAIERFFLTQKIAIFFDRHSDVTIAIERMFAVRFAYARDFDALTVVDAGGNVDFD